MMENSNKDLNDQTNNLLEWGELLTAVCKRPQMYTGSNHFRAALDFIGGYLYAQKLLSPEIETEWRQFNYWLAQKFGYPRNYAWYYAQEYFADDEAALEAFPLLLKEFRNGKKSNERAS